MRVLDASDTIAACSSPSAPGLRGIVRLSGPEAMAISEAQCRARRLRLAGLSSVVPARLQSWPARRSITGQPLVEIHTTGSLPILQALLAACYEAGARPAAPGEFTLRAFLHGRVDLVEAEAVLGVIHARTPAQLDSALAQLAGGFSKPIVGLRDRLLDILAHLEAGLDFVEEADVDPIGRGRLALELSEAAAEMARLARRLNDRDRTASAPRVVLTGRPNSGKSRLFNALAGAELALVSAAAGTTRDEVTALVRFDGIEVLLVDTAGEDRPGDAIEAQVQRRRAGTIAEADLLIRCFAADAADATTVPPELGRSLRVATKCDLAEPPEGALATSAVSLRGVDALRLAIAAAIRSTVDAGEGVMSTSPRCRETLGRASSSLGRAAGALAGGLGDEFVAHDLRGALDDLGQVIGAVVTDDILDRIFSRFCIGK